MSVMVTMWLFGKPGHELDEGGDVTGEEIRALAECLRQRLTETGDAVEKMTKTGWDAQMGLYDVMLTHPYVRTETEARTRLDDLGIDPDLVSIMEFEGDDDDDDFEDEGEFEGEEFRPEEGPQDR